MHHVAHCQNRCCRHEPLPKNGQAIGQLCRPQHDTVEGWMPPVNIYLPCECVSVCGRAWRQELLWGFICSMTRQPVIYEHLELLFKHSLISRQTFPEARAEQEWPRPDKTSHRLPASHPTRELSVGHAGWEQSIKVHVCLQGVLYECSFDSSEQQCDTAVTEIICLEFFPPSC